MNTDQNNNENNLSSISLGAVGDSKPIDNVNLEETIESLDDTTPTPQVSTGPFDPAPPLQTIEIPTPKVEEPVVTPPLVEQVPLDVDLSMNNVPPVPPLDYVIPPQTNNPVPGYNGVGTVPPLIEEPVNPNQVIPDPPVPPKSPKKINKFIFIVIILLAMASVACGVYFLLKIANEETTSKPSIQAKEVHIEIGTPIDNISTDLENWATIASDFDSSTCTLDISSITETNTLNKKYDFTIKCSNKEVKGQALIVDTVAPQVKTKDLNMPTNSNVSPDDFIEAIEDNSDCTTTFVDEEIVKNSLKTPGEYTIKIKVVDKANNEVIVESKLIVSGVDFYLSCSNNNQTDKLAIYQNNFKNELTRSYTFTFATLEEYNAVKNTNTSNDSMLYEGITGTPTFDDEKLTLTLTKTLAEEEITSENIPQNYLDIRSSYTSKGYTCNITTQ